LFQIKKQPLDSRQLLAFVTTARTGSFTLAGKELHLSQSAVSHAVKALENEVGHRLLDREGKQLQITPAGEHLLHYAEKILAEMAVAQVSLDQRARTGMNRLRVGANSSFSQSLLPGILGTFCDEFPDWSVSVKVGDTQECVNWLELNTIDVAIAIAPNKTEAVDVTPLFADEVMWMLAPSHPWAATGSAVMEEVSAQHFVCSSASSYAARLLEKHLARDGVRLNCRMELGTLEAVKRTVKANAGITALSPWAARKELEEKSLVAVPLGKRKLKRNWCLLRAPGRKSGLGEERFAKLSQEATKVITTLTLVATMLVNGVWLAPYVEFEFLTVAI